jgi:hypothetical protein
LDSYPSESQLSVLHSDSKYEKLIFNKNQKNPAQSEFSFVTQSQNSISSKLQGKSLEALYSKITTIMLRMQDDERLDSIDSLMQSVITHESQLKSEKCRNKLSMLYLLFIGL